MACCSDGDVRPPGWTANAGAQPDTCSVFSERDPDGFNCQSNATYSQATAFCASLLEGCTSTHVTSGLVVRGDTVNCTLTPSSDGAPGSCVDVNPTTATCVYETQSRLCTAKELEARCSEGTGCTGFDEMLVWSSTAGDFRGLLSDSAEALLDGSTGPGFWYAIGTAAPHEGGIPGPTRGPGVSAFTDCASGSSRAGSYYAEVEPQHDACGAGLLPFGHQHAKRVELWAMCSAECGGAHGKRGYFLSTGVGVRNRNWADGQAQCELLGADLAIVTSAEQNAEIASLLADEGVSQAWIGLNRLDSSEFAWGRGTGAAAAEYFHWGTDQPVSTATNDCVDFHVDELWRARSCEQTRRIVCQRSCPAEQCCTDVTATCADTNGGLPGADAFDCGSSSNDLSSSPGAIACAAPGCSQIECCTTVTATCADTNGGGAGEPSFDCSRHPNEVAQNSSDIDCIAAGCTETECCTREDGVLTCADVNGGLDGADAFDCSSHDNAISATPASITCAAACTDTVSAMSTVNGCQQRTDQAQSNPRQGQPINVNCLTYCI